MRTTFQSLKLDDAEVLALKVLKQVMEEKLDENNVELAIVTPTSRFRILKKDELQAVIAKIETASTTDDAGDSTAAAPATGAESAPAAADSEIPVEQPMS